MRLSVLAVVLALACSPVAVPSVEVPGAARAADESAFPEPASARAVPIPLAEPRGGALTDPEVVRTEAYVRLAATLARDPGLPVFSGRLANWPITGRITSPFGPRWGGFHNGIDIAGAMNTPVRAAAAGQIVAAGKPSLAYGDTATIVIVAHGGELATLYVHLSDERPPIVRVGQRVTAGEVIAYTGSTGWSTGPHVHFMTVLSGRAVDPLAYLP